MIREGTSQKSSLMGTSKSFQHPVASSCVVHLGVKVGKMPLEILL